MSDRLVKIHEEIGPVVATAIHDGHAVRHEVAKRLALDEATRLREEDPFTGTLAAVAPTWLVPVRSRFEVDLNRPRDQAVYRGPDDAWDLDVWSEPFAEPLIERSLAEYDAFYALLERVLRERERRHGCFVLLDLHSYNYRREGADAPPADPALHPEVNVGTGMVDRARWGALIDRFCADLAACRVRGHPLDVRENVRFKGGYLCQRVHERFPERGCALAVELKKVFMDEWTGRPDHQHLDQLTAAFEASVPLLLGELACGAA